MKARALLLLRSQALDRWSLTFRGSSGIPETLFSLMRSRRPFNSIFRVLEYKGEKMCLGLSFCSGSQGALFILIWGSVYSNIKKQL